MHDNKQKIIIALKKARTSIDRIITKIESEEQGGTKCFDVMQQTLAAVGLLKKANHHILEQHLIQQMEDIGNIKSKKERDGLRADLLKVVQVAQRS